MGDPAAPQDILPHALNTIGAVRAARKLRPDLVIAGDVPFSSVSLASGTLPLAAILRGSSYKEEWRFLRGLEQASPWDAYPSCSQPPDNERILFQGAVAVGMLWARQNGSTIVSFAFPPDWIDSHVNAQLAQTDDAGNTTSTTVALPNISTPAHVEMHSQLIRNFGLAIAASSLIYDGDGFSVRMFFHDHDPPHIHIYFGAGPSAPVVRLAIGTLDVLSGKFPAGLPRIVTAWVAQKKRDLLDNWARCRAGQHPYKLN